MGIFSGGSFPTSGGTVIITQDGYQTLNLTGNILTISGSNSSVDLSSYLDDTNTTNTSLTLNASNVLTLTDSDSGTVTVDLTSLVTAAGGTAESTHIPVKNTSGATITKGTPVYITGNVGSSDRLQIAPADASDPTKMPAIGLLETDLINNAEGYVVQGGYLTNITTDIIDGTSTSSNDTVYVKVGGGITMTKPTGSTNYIQNIAKVARVGSGSSGSLIVSSILRTNDIPNLADGQVWVGSTTYPVSTDFNLQEVTDGGNSTTNAISVGHSNTPAYFIDVQNSTGGTLARFKDSDSTHTGIVIAGDVNGGWVGSDFFTNGIYYQDSIDALRFYSNSAEKMRITSTGNVGINTSSPSYKLSVSGHIGTTNGNSIYIGGATGDTVIGRLGNTSGVLNLEGDATRSIRLGSATNGEVVRIDNVNSRVGIGTSSPSYKLDVETSLTGNQTIASFKTSESSYNGLLIAANNNAGWIGNGTITADEGILFQDTSSAMRLYTNSSERMRITSTGAVGIGATSPAFKTTIYSDSSTDSFPLVVGQPNLSNEFVGIGLSGFVASNGAVKAGFVLDRKNTYGVGDIHILNNTTTDNSNATLADSKFTILQNGNVGIGTTSASAKTHIVGSGNTSGTNALLVENSDGADLLKITDSGVVQIGDSNNTNSEILRIASGSDNAYIGFFPSNNYTREGYIGFLGDDMYIVQRNNNRMKFYTNDSLRLEIYNDGQLKLNSYTSTTHDGTPTSFLGVDASGNVVKTTSSGVLTPTLQEVTDEGNTTTNDITIKGTDNILRLETDSANGNKRLDLSVGADAVGRIKANQSAQQLAFETTGTERMRITSTGAVGIGTSSPSAKLHVFDSGTSYTNLIEGITLSNNAGGTDDRLPAITWDYGTAGTPTFAAIETTRASSTGGNLVFHTAQTNGTLTEGMLIDSSQNIGIGTSTPSEKLTVDGNILAQSTGNASLYLERAAGAEVLAISQSNLGAIGTQNNFRFDIRSNGTTRASFLTNGNVGIATTIPGAKLDIVGSSIGLRVKKSDLSDVLRVYAQGSGIFMNQGDVHITDDLIVGSNGTPSAKLHVIGSGNTSGTTALLVENSDGTDLMQITNGGNAIMNVNYLQLDEFAAGRYLKITPAITGVNHKIESNSSADIEIHSSNGQTFTLKGDGQLLLNTYTSTTHDGTPVKILGVDASGNVVKTTRTYQTKSSLSFNGSGEATVTLPSTALYGVTATLESSAAEFIVIAQYLAGTSVKFKLYDHTGSAVASVTRTVHYTYTI